MNTMTASGTLSLAATEGSEVPFIRLDSAFPELFAELMETVERIGRDSAFTLGPELERFEAAFAEFCRAPARRSASPPAPPPSRSPCARSGSARATR